MKKYIILSAALALCNLAFSQKVKESEVPAIVKQSFEKRFPGVKAEKWELENGNYEIEFEKDEVETSAVFNAQGNLLETEQEIEVRALPAEIQAYIGKNYTGYKITEAAKITTSDNHIQYEAEVKKSSDKFDLIFDASGHFLRKAD